MHIHDRDQAIVPGVAATTWHKSIPRRMQDLMTVAGKALKANITTLGPRVLPLSEQLRFAANVVARRCLGMKHAPYVPDFSFALHST